MQPDLFSVYLLININDYIGITVFSWLITYCIVFLLYTQNAQFYNT